MPDVTRLKVMGSQHEQTERIEALRGLIERLSAPDLTLAEGEALRGRLSDLLERDDPPAGWDRGTPSPSLAPPRGRCDGARPQTWSPEASMRAAG
jgi:hypothetical protein